MVDPRDGNFFIIKVVFENYYELDNKCMLRSSSLRFLSFNNSWPAFYVTFLATCCLKH